ncbi:MFS transporter [Trichococcus alkaliphilus]|uniref:MFS transporter n=1 Tax=Trichococcus alkaliphilus TaxID=2052943 RepID=UPI001961F30B
MLKSFSLQEKSWIMYDWANSAYSIIISSVILPLFYKSITTGEGIAPNLADSYWGYATSAATLVIAISAPLLGTIGDYPKWKMRLFKSFFLLGVVATAALSFTDNWRLLLVFYMLTTIGFSGANIFYDAFLVDVATEERMDRVSTYGFAMGYIGGSTIPFVLSILLIMFGENIGIPRTVAIKASFLFTAFWWIAFTIPMLRNVKQRYFVPASEHIIHDSFGRLYKTLHQIRSHKKMFLFLIAYFFYIDGLNTIIHMAAVFGDSIGIVSDMLMIAVLVIPILSFPFTILYGKLAKRFGSKKMILVGIVIYLLACLLAFRMTTAVEFWILATLVATSQGGIQALSRSYFAKLVPKENANEYFGFYNILGKFAAIMGPALYALTSQLTGDSRNGLASISLLFIIGGVLMLRTEEN